MKQDYDDLAIMSEVVSYQEAFTVGRSNIDPCASYGYVNFSYDYLTEEPAEDTKETP